MLSKKYPLVEAAAHSYSGICEIAREQNKAKALLLQLDEYYNELIKRQNELEKELEHLKSEIGMVVDNFIYLHKSLELGEKPLTFVSGDNFTEVKVLCSNKINYEKYPITFITD